MFSEFSADNGLTPRGEGHRTLTILPAGIRVAMEPGETVLAALRRAGIEIESPCGGEGVCGRCRVRLEDVRQAPETPHQKLSTADVGRGWRLACQMNPPGDAALHLPVNALVDARILEGERLFAERLSPAVQVHEGETGYRLRYGGGAEQPLSPWDARWTPKGCAIDIGTTTLVVSLYSLVTGEELGTASAVNPQTRFGHDVLSRIQKGSEPAGLAQLAATVRDALNELVDDVCAGSRSNHQEILDGVVGGNPTMLQLAAALDPGPLGRLPFVVGIASGRSHSSQVFGLKTHPQALVYVPPIAHAFVGSDISAGLLAARFFDRDGPLLFIDIGTNGELALNAGGRWLVTSAAAGPAFEGMGISQGMRAAAGAVETVEVGPAGLAVGVIGGGAASGICGSGLIDAIASLLRLGVIEPSGRMRPAADLVEPLLSNRVAVDGRPAFRLAPEVLLTQRDVRELQLAKGAIRTAIDLLLKAAGVDPDELQEIILAGAFGYHLRPASLEAIGLIPAGTADRVTFAGNTSKVGAGLLLLDADLRRGLEDQMEGVQHLALPASDSFQAAFVGNLGFPNLPQSDSNL